MKVSLEWLGDFITWKVRDHRAIADRLTEAMGEIDDIVMQGEQLDRCCVGRVKSLAQHPNADRLRIAEIETDDGVKRVVCGGTNLKDGMLVAFAHIGASVQHGKDTVVLQKVKIRGEESEGMICAAEEIGLSERFPPAPGSGERPIVDLTDLNLKPGQDLATALGLTDTVLHIDNHAITHRPDLFSHLGVARECVALGLATWKKEPTFKHPHCPTKALPFALECDVPALVPHYRSVLLKVDGPGTTPDWMRRRLEATGWRSVSLPVDITNYVMMEIGMPLHCFDADDLKGTVRFRHAKKGEKITTLDSVERALPEGALVLSDDEGIFDLLGIMGGLRSSTKDSSRHLFLQAAVMDPVAIRRTVITMGHRTDAATIYEKGVMPITADWGFEHAIALFMQLIPGAELASRRQSWGTSSRPKSISLDLARLESAIGTPCTAPAVKKIFVDLGCSSQAAKKGHLAITPPLWRRDLRTSHDLTEEVARVMGYNALPSSPPLAPMQLPERDTRLAWLRMAMRDEEFLELLPLSLVGPNLIRNAGFDPKSCPTVENAIGEELSLMTPSTLPRLLEHAGRFLRDERELRTFTIANVFGKKEEHRELGMLIATKEDRSVIEAPLPVLEATIVRSLKRLNLPCTIVPCDAPPVFAHPGQCGTVRVALGGKTVDLGTVCTVHPAVRARFDLPKAAAFLMLDCTALMALPPMTAIAKPLPTFPAISYDVTLERTQNDRTDELLRKLRGSHPHLESVEIVDIYAPSSVKMNVSLRCTYRASDRTLTEDEAKTAHMQVMRAA